MTCIVADEMYTLHLTGWGHPETPTRYRAIITALEDAGLKTDENTLTPRKATKDEILLCHQEEYYDLVRTECALTQEIGITDGSLMLSTGDANICPESFEVALFASGGVLTAIDAIMAGKARNVFAVVRPPGHHACRGAGMGFCIFNNVAIGARYVQQRYGLEKVLIADWDVHHGNGTQDIFNDDPSVYYFSTHQYPFYPGTGAAEDSGSGQAKGTVINVPIPAGSSSRERILEAFSSTLPKAMQQFLPDFVLISTGFDAHHDDLIGSCNLTTEDFSTLTSSVKEIADTFCQGRLVSVLEGGYNLDVLAKASVAHVMALCAI